MRSPACTETMAGSGTWVQLRCVRDLVFVCLQMAVCMTAPLTGTNDNGQSNRSPRAAERLWVFVCVRGKGQGTGSPDTQHLPPLAPLLHSSARYKNKEKTHTHIQTGETELAWSSFKTHTVLSGTKEEWSSSAGTRGIAITTKMNWARRLLSTSSLLKQAYM